MEKAADRLVSRIMRKDISAPYLSPDVFKRLLIWRLAPSVTVNELAKSASLPWAEQAGRVFDG